MSKPENIMFLNFSKGWGGLEMFSANLFHWLSQAGFNILFLVEEDSKLYKSLLHSEFSNKVIPLKTHKYIDPWTFKKIRSYLREGDIKLLHTFKSSDIFFSVLSTLGLKTPPVKKIHHLQMLPSRSRKDLLHSFLYKRLDGLIAITDQINQRVRALWPVKPDIVQTIHYGLDPELYHGKAAEADPIKEKYKIPKNKTVLSVVGQICEIKGQLLTAKAFHPLLKKYPDLVLVLAGSPPENEEAYYNQLKNYIDKYNLKHDIILTGFCSKVPELLSVVDIFILSSTEEAFGLVVIEAMASGCITIASNAGGVPEILSSGQDGFLFTSQDQQNLQDAIEKALALSEQEKQELVRAGQEKVRDKFALSRFLDDMIEYYETTINSPAES